MGLLTSILTIGGAILGGWIGGPWGAAIGSSLGAFVGAAIEGTSSSNSPTIDSIRAQGASEGDPIQYGIGINYRIGGEVVWRGDLFAHKPGVEKHPIQYQMPICISFGRTFTGKPILKIIELLADGRPIYWSYDEVSIVGTDIAATLVEVTTWNAGTGTSAVTQRYLDLSTSGTALIELNAGRNVTVSGFAAGGDNGAWRVLTSAATTARLYDPTNALHVFVTEAAGATVSIFAPEDTQLPNEISYWSSMEIGLGSVDQAPPATMVAIEGAANVPGMSGLIWVAFDNLPLNNFGTAVPRFEARIKERNDTDLAVALYDILVGMGLDDCEVDTVDAVGIFYGFAMRGPKSIKDALIPLLLTYNLVTQEKDLKLRILHRLAATNTTIDEAELGAQEGDRPKIIPPFAATRQDPKRLPAEVQFTYMDIDKRGESGSQPYRRTGLPLINVMQVSVPVMLDKDQARRVAKRIPYGEAVSSEKHATRLPPSRLDTYESDRLYTTSSGRERVTLLTRVARGNNYEIEVEGQRDDPAMYENEDALGGASGDTFGPPAATADPLALIADTPPLLDDDVATPLLRCGAVRSSSQGTWASALLHESLGGAYGLFEQVDAETLAGVTVGTIASGPVGVWDGATTITVDIRGGGPPTSSTDDEVLAGGANWFLIGGEVIGAVNVALVSTGRYALSRLVRGLMDTADRVGAHSANEPCFQVRPFGALSTRVYAVADVGTVRLYDASPLNGVPDGVDAVTDTLNGSTVRPFSGCLPIGTRGAPSANDWTVAWTPRTRRPLFPIFGTTYDLAEATEVYEVEVWDSTFTTLKRTITGTASGAGSVVSVAVALAPTVVYASADQVTDFGSNQATIYLRIYQKGAALLRSKKLETTHTG